MPDSINPYESPHAAGVRGPFGQRLRRALRRAVATYRAEIARRQVTRWQHLAAWLAIGMLLFVATAVLLGLAAAAWSVLS